MCWRLLRVSCVCSFLFALLEQETPSWFDHDVAKTKQKQQQQQQHLSVRWRRRKKKKKKKIRQYEV